MSLDIYLPVAKHGANLLLLIGLGGVVGFISGLFGVGGGFLMTPLLILTGIPPVVAAASDSNQIISAATSGTYAHARMGNVDFKMGLLLLSGGFVGSTLGVRLINFLRSMGEADFLIKVTYVVMLGFIGGYMFVESISSLRRPLETRSVDGETIPPGLASRLSRHIPGKMVFERSGLTLSPILPLAGGALVGLISSILGVGGGFIMVPLMFYLLRMPMHLVVGTNLFQEVFLCFNVTVMQSINNHSVDLVLALILLAGSSIGAQFGARASRRLPAEQMRLLLAIIVLGVMAKIFLGLVLKPEYLLDMKGF